MSHFWFRVIGWRFVIGVVLLLVSFILLVGSGNRSWFAGAIGAVLVLGVAFAAALYVVHYRGSVGRLRRMAKPEATFEIGADGFRISSDMGIAEVPWSQVREIWRCPEFWLMFLAPSQFITLPAADLTEEVRAYIVERLRAHGGRVA